MPEEQRDVAHFAQKVVMTYREGSEKEILDLWTGDSYEDMKYDMKNDPGRLKETRAYFAKPEDFRIEFVLHASEFTCLYFRPVFLDGKFGDLKLLRLVPVANELFLVNEYWDYPYADSLLENMNIIAPLAAKNPHPGEK